MLKGRMPGRAAEPASRREGFFQKDLFFCVLASTFLFGLAAHGYCYFNLTYSHDSLLICQGADGPAQISIGRFLLPVYLKIRGDFYAPWLVGLLSLLFLSCAAYLALRLLEIRNRPLCVFSCGVLAVNASLTLTNATYLKDADVYMLALLLAVAAVYLWARVPWGLFPAAGALCLSLGLYQAFFQAAVFLSMVFVVKTILERADLREILLTGGSAVASLLLGLIVYSIAMNAVLAITDIEMAGTYNSIAHMVQLGDLSQILYLVKETCRGAIHAFAHPETAHSAGMAALNLLLTAASAGLLGWLAVSREIRGWPLVLLLADVLVMPFGMNVVYLISQGVDHTLMHFSFFFYYVFAAMLLDAYWQERPPDAGLPWCLPGWIIPCVLAAFLFNSVIYANQVYLKKDLEYQATLLTMTRVVDRIEQTEGYTAGKTRVALVGTLSASVLSVPREGLSDLAGIGLDGTFSLTYPTTYHWYFRRILAYPIALLSVADSEKMAQLDSVRRMPAFPAPGSCAMVDGVVVVKLS